MPCLIRISIIAFSNIVLSLELGALVSPSHLLHALLLFLYDIFASYPVGFGFLSIIEY